MSNTDTGALSGDLASVSTKLADFVVSRRHSLPTPIYLYDEEEIGKAVARFRALFPDPIRLFYSLKANPQPEIVRIMSANSVGPELASDGERRAVDVAGVTWSTVLAGGVAKSNSYLQRLSERKPLAIVVDSVAEWKRLESVIDQTDWTPRILFRISPGESTGGLDMAGESQFGMEQSDALDLATQLQDSEAGDFLGLHYYFGSQRLAVKPIRQSLEIVGQTVAAFKKAGCAPRVVDIGLGCGVPYLMRDATIDKDELTGCIAEELRNDAWSGVELWSEAGRALVATSGLFVARVLECKQLHGKRFALLDGGVNVHNPGIGVGRFFRSNPRMAFVTDNNPRPTVSTDIVGNLCTSADCLARAVEAPELQEGDLVLIPNSGAYCQTTGFWGFNSQPLCREAVITTSDDFKLLEPQHTYLQD